jgi:hypothetical protein
MCSAVIRQNVPKFLKYVRATIFAIEPKLELTSNLGNKTKADDGDLNFVCA